MKKLASFLAAVMAATCMMMPVSAADFTPSVQGKEAPAIETVQTQTGEDVVALIEDTSGNEVQGVMEDQLIITPVAKADEAPEEIAEPLLAAYEQIKAASNLKEIVPNIEDVVKKVSENLKVDNLVVRDLFDVSVSDDIKALLDGGNTITIRFQLGISKDDTVLCLHNIEADKWEVIDPSKVVNNGDGTVSVTFDSLSPVAFVVEKQEEAIPVDKPETSEEAVESVPTAETGTEETENTVFLWIGLGFAMVAAIGAGAWLKVKKK